MEMISGDWLVIDRADRVAGLGGELRKQNAASAITNAEAVGKYTAGGSQQFDVNNDLRREINNLAKTQTL